MTEKERHTNDLFPGVVKILLPNGKMLRLCVGDRRDRSGEGSDEDGGGKHMKMECRRVFLM